MARIGGRGRRKMKIKLGTLVLLALATMAGAAVLAHAQTAAQPSGPAATAIRAEDFRLPIRLEDRRFDLEARVFRPAGPGPFPLVVINHGTPVSISEAPSEKIGFTKASRWFAAQGYMVVLAMRPGFGASDGPYLETSRPCDDRDYVQDGRTTGALEGAIVEAASALPGVDPKRIVVVGQSAGGFGAIAMADRPPPGVLGVISFAGGRGGDDHEHICSGEKRLEDAAGVFGRTNQVPGLWLFAANDHFFPPRIGHAMFDAYQAGSRPKMTFVDLPPFDGDGHHTFGGADPSVWAGPVTAFLQQIGVAPR